MLAHGAHLHHFILDLNVNLVHNKTIWMYFLKMTSHDVQIMSQQCALESSINVIKKMHLLANVLCSDSLLLQNFKVISRKLERTKP